MEPTTDTFEDLPTNEQHKILKDTVKEFETEVENLESKLSYAEIELEAAQETLADFEKEHSIQGE